MASDRKDERLKNLLGGSSLASLALNQAALVAGSLADVLTGATGVGTAPGDEWAALEGDSKSLDEIPAIPATSSTASQISAYPDITRTPARIASVPFGPPPWAAATQASASTSASPSSLSSRRRQSLQTPLPYEAPAIAGGAPAVSAGDGAVDDDLFAGLEVDPHVPVFPTHMGAGISTVSLPSHQQVVALWADVNVAEMETQQKQQQPAAATTAESVFLSGLQGSEEDLLGEFTNGANSSSRGGLETLSSIGGPTGGASSQGPRFGLGELLVPVVLPGPGVSVLGGAPSLQLQPASLGAGVPSENSDVRADVASLFPFLVSAGGAPRQVPDIGLKKRALIATSTASLGDSMEELVRLAMSSGPASERGHAASPARGQTATLPPSPSQLLLAGVNLTATPLPSLQPSPLIDDRDSTAAVSSTSVEPEASWPGKIATRYEAWVGISTEVAESGSELPYFNRLLGACDGDLDQPQPRELQQQLQATVGALSSTPVGLEAGLTAPSDSVSVLFKHSRGIQVLPEQSPHCSYGPPVAAATDNDDGDLHIVPEAGIASATGSAVAGRQASRTGCGSGRGEIHWVAAALSDAEKGCNEEAVRPPDGLAAGFSQGAEEAVAAAKQDQTEAVAEVNATGGDAVQECGRVDPERPASTADNWLSGCVVQERGGSQPDVPSSSDGNATVPGDLPETEVEAVILPLSSFSQDSVAALRRSPHHERQGRTGQDGNTARRRHGRAFDVVHVGPFTLLEHGDVEGHQATGAQSRTEQPQPFSPRDPEMVDAEGEAAIGEMEGQATDRDEGRTTEDLDQSEPFGGRKHVQPSSQALQEGTQEQMEAIIAELQVHSTPCTEVAVGRWSFLTTTDWIAETLAEETEGPEMEPMEVVALFGATVVAPLEELSAEAEVGALVTKDIGEPKVEPQAAELIAGKTLEPEVQPLTLPVAESMEKLLMEAGVGAPAVEQLFKSEEEQSAAVPGPAAELLAAPIVVDLMGAEAVELEVMPSVMLAAELVDDLITRAEVAELTTGREVEPEMAEPLATLTAEPLKELLARMEIVEWTVEQATESEVAEPSALATAEREEPFTEPTAQRAVEPAVERLAEQGAAPIVRPVAEPMEQPKAEVEVSSLAKAEPEPVGEQLPVLEAGLEAEPESTELKISSDGSVQDHTGLAQSCRAFMPENTLRMEAKESSTKELEEWPANWQGDARGMLEVYPVAAIAAEPQVELQAPPLDVMNAANVMTALDQATTAAQPTPDAGGETAGKQPTVNTVAEMNASPHVVEIPVWGIETDALHFIDPATSESTELSGEASVEREIAEKAPGSEAVTVEELGPGGESVTPLGRAISTEAVTGVALGPAFDAANPESAVPNIIAATVSESELGAAEAMTTEDPRAKESSVAAVVAEQVLSTMVVEVEAEVRAPVVNALTEAALENELLPPQAAWPWDTTQDIAHEQGQEQGQGAVAASALSIELFGCRDGNYGYSTAVDTAAVPQPPPQAQMVSAHDPFMRFMDFELQQPSQQVQETTSAIVPELTAATAPLPVLLTGAFRDLQLEFGEPDPEPLAEAQAATAASTSVLVPATESLTFTSIYAPGTSSPSSKLVGAAGPNTLAAAVAMEVALAPHLGETAGASSSSVLKPSMLLSDLSAPKPMTAIIVQPQQPMTERVPSPQLSPLLLPHLLPPSAPVLAPSQEEIGAVTPPVSLGPGADVELLLARYGVGDGAQLDGIAPESTVATMAAVALTVVQSVQGPSPPPLSAAPAPAIQHTHDDKGNVKPLGITGSLAEQTEVGHSGTTGEALRHNLDESEEEDDQLDLSDVLEVEHAASLKSPYTTLLPPPAPSTSVPAGCRVTPGAVVAAEAAPGAVIMSATGDCTASAASLQTPGSLPFPTLPVSEPEGGLSAAPLRVAPAVPLAKAAAVVTEVAAATGHCDGGLGYGSTENAISSPAVSEVEDDCGIDLADLEQHLPPHELALMRAERAEAALLAGPSNLASEFRGSGVSGAAPSPIALILSNANLLETSTPSASVKASSRYQDRHLQPHAQSPPSAGGNHTGPALLDPLAGLTALLADAAQDWNSSGRPDASGAMVGRSVALRLEELHTALPDITQHWLTAGRPRVVTISNAIMAVGTSLGAALVFQLPVSGANAAAATGPGGAASGGGAHPQGASHGSMWSQIGLEHAGLPHYCRSGGGGGGGVNGGSLAMSGLGSGSGPAGTGAGSSSGAIIVVGEPRSEVEAVTALALSTVTGQGDPLWLLVGHASGFVAAWDLQRRPPKQMALITGQHDLPIVHVSFFPGRGASMALSADRRGNLLLHTFTHIVLKTAVASRTVLGGNMGSIGTIVHLTPFFAPAATPPPASAQPPAAVPDATATISAAPPPPPPPPASAGASASTAALAPPGARVGDGMVALCATTGCHIGRFKPSGELVPLYSIPRPSSVPSPSIPCAAWLPHQRRSARPPPVAVTPPEGNNSAITTAICAVLAVGWHDEVLFVDVPLVGDHNSPPPPPSATEAPPSGSFLSGTAAPASLQSPPSGQQQKPLQPLTKAPQQPTGPARRSLLRAAAAFTGVARGAATAAVAAAANAAAVASAATSTALAAAAAGPASLDAQTAVALAQRLPLSVTRIWNATSTTECRPGSPDISVCVVGLNWYDSDALGVVLLLGLAMRLVVVDLELAVREQVDCIDTPYITGLMPPAPRGGMPTAPDTLAGSGARVVFLGNSSTLYCSRLLTWQERLRTLADIGKWKLGLRFALDFYKLHLARAAVAATAATAASATGVLICSPPVPAGAGADASYPSALRSWMASLAVGFVKSALGTALRAASAEGMARLQLDRLPAPAVRQLREATAVAVLACLVAGREHLLFDTVFPLCRDAGAAGPLVEAVEVAVLAGALPRPAPELVQALVEHLAVVLARPDRVERCVLHFDITSLDLDQVLRLCEAHHLHSASAAIYNQLHDYKRPMLDMLEAAAGLDPATSSGHAPQKGQALGRLPPPPDGSATPAAPDREQRRRAAGFKLLVYLRCIFRRQAFPPGTGVLPDIIQGAGRHGTAGGPDDVKAQLLGLLLFLEPRDLAREWRRPLEQLPPALLTGPHPALRVLLSIDVAAAVSVLGGAVAGWDAVETDLREAAGRPTAELNSVLVATQVLVNAFIQLLESDDSGTNLADKSENGGPEVVLDFIAGLLAAGRVVVRPSFALRLLSRVADKATALIVKDVPAEAEGTARGREGRGDGAAATSERQREALEGLFERLVTAVGVNSRVSRFDPEKLSVQETDAVLDMAQYASFPRALATLHHLRGDYYAALACHMKLPSQWVRCSSDDVSGTDVVQAKVAGSGDERGWTGAVSAFAYVRAFLGNGGGATAAQRAAIYDALLAMAPELVAADPHAIAQLLLAHYPGESQAAAFLERLSGNRRLQYDFLTAAVQHKNALAQDLGGGPDDGENDVPRGPRVPSYSIASLHTLPTVAMAALGAWMSQPAVSNMYVELLCEFEPCAVLPFLEQHHDYDVRHCIRLCSTAGVWDAEAYLHERLGELEAALALHLRNVELRNRELDEAVRSGAVPSYHVGSAAGLVFFDHLAWLLELSPRLVLLMQGSLGRHAAEAAEWARRGQRSAAVPSLLSPTIVTVTTGADSQQSTPQSTPQQQSTGNAVASSGPPLELVRAWEALVRAVAFCGRCFKQRQQRPSQSRLRPDANAASWPGSSSVNASGSETSASPSPSHCWYALLHAYVEEVQRRQRRCSSGAGPGAEQARGGGGAMGSGPVRARPVVSTYDASATAALATAGDAVAISECQERVLRHVLGVFLEEVISSMSDDVPPSEVVRHIIDTYGSQDFGGFRSTLLGLLGSCAYEQAIMCSAQRLISRGVFASHQQRLALVAGCLPSAALCTKSHQGEIDYMSTAVSYAASTSSASDPGVDSVAGGGGGGGKEAAAGFGASMPSSAVTTTSPAATAPFWRLHAEGPSGDGGGGLSKSVAFSRDGSAALGTTTALGLPLAPAGDLRGLRADGQFLAALQAAGGMGEPVRGATGPVIRAGVRVAAGSGHRLMRSPWRPATSAAAMSGSSGAGSASRAGAPASEGSTRSGRRASGPAVGGSGLDIDELLDWTRAFGS